MRSLVIAAAVLLLIPAVSQAQRRGDKELTGQIGWLWGGTQEYTTAYLGYPAGSFHANANVNYGGALTFFQQDGLATEIAYSYQSTDLMIRPTGLKEQKIADLATQYIHINGLRLVPMNERTEGYVLGGLGTTVYSATGYSSKWLFSIAAGLGARVHINERMLLRLQTRILIPMNFDYGSAYFGSGGAAVSVGGGTAIVQGDASVGLTMKLGGHS